VGVRKLKSHLSRYLRRVRRGERVVVTDRGQPVAVMSPAAEEARKPQMDAMLRDGSARWQGGKPRGTQRPARIKGHSVGQAVAEGRR
ncbi:MAG: type II toxin-antitoxin system prevent-host-death family antitoxin, partial [Armatimonadota bacterium]